MIATMRELKYVPALNACDYSVLQVWVSHLPNAIIGQY